MVVVTRTIHAAETRMAQEPLRAAQVAASTTGRSIRTVAPAVAERWEGASGPSRAVAERYVDRGNALLEPAFYALATRHGGTPSEGAKQVSPDVQSECLYLAVQPGGGSFDPTAVADLVQVCYQAGDGSALAYWETAVRS